MFQKEGVLTPPPSTYMNKVLKEVVLKPPPPTHINKELNGGGLKASSAYTHE